jgi:DNA polymerase alpha subunit A
LIKHKNYKFTELCFAQLNVKRTEIEAAAILPHYNYTQSLMNLIKHTENDAYLCTCLAFGLNAVPLTKQLTTLSGNTWSKTLVGGRAERIEVLLLHEFHRAKFICPDRKGFDKKKGGPRRAKAKYAGKLFLFAFVVSLPQLTFLGERRFGAATTGWTL